MRISEIEITNILGTRSASFRPGTLTVISGANGTGKTSIIDALRRVFEGGSDTALLRHGAKFGEVVLVLDDGRKVKTRVTAKSTSYEIENPDGSMMKAPRAFIEELADALSVDPGKIVNAKPKELAALLLEVMPIRFSRQEYNACIVGNAAAERGTEGRGGQSFPDFTLDDLGAQRAQVYEARTNANRRAKDAEATARSIRTSLPEQDDQDWAARAAELRSTLDEAKQARESEIKTIDRVERETIEEIKARAEQEIADTRREAAEKRRQIDQEHEPTLMKISAAVASAEEKQRVQDRAAGLRENITGWEEKARTAAREAAECTATLEAIDELKRRKLSSLPIPGLEVRDGQVYYNDTVFEHVNLRTRIELAFQICALRSNGKLPFLLLDEAEAFDSESWQEFQAGVRSSGFQVIAARVSDGPLNISVQDQPELAAV